MEKKELDVYLPELNLAFEYNGDYHHKLKEEKYSGYHVQKKKDCEKKGIKLIEILDTQWRKNKEKLKKFIKEHAIIIVNHDSTKHLYGK